jgi:hypothetical protein
MSVGGYNRTKFIASNGELIWQANPGMQEMIFYWSNPEGVVFIDPATHAPLPPNKGFICDEILAGGPRGGGKTAAGIAWAAGYVNNPKYVGTLLRLSNEAMKETIEKAWAIYRMMGAVKKGNPVSFLFPTGAMIYTGYLKDDASFEQYRGHEYHRIVIEEAEQIKSEALYAAILSSNRTTVPGLRPQILLTANPDGPGAQWLKARFVKVRQHANGELFPYGTPMYDPHSRRVKIYLHGPLKDNPQLLQQDPHYADRLADPAHPESRRKAWIDGDWDISAGMFYPNFRPRGISSELKEFPEAFHVIPAYNLPPWCHRWMSCDWGHQHHTAVYWYALGPDKRIHVEDELVVAGMGADELGAEIARRSLAKLETMPEPRLRCYLSPDAFQVRDKDHMISDQIAYGVQRILGPGSSVLMEFTPVELAMSQMDLQGALRLREERLAASELDGSSIWFTRANNDRKAGWEFIRGLLRFTPLRKKAEPDHAYGDQILATRGIVAYQKYMAMFAEEKNEVLPRIRIHDKCPILIETFPKLISDYPNNPEDVKKFDSTETTIGDDPADSLRYGCMGFKDHESKVPRDVYIGEEIDRIAAANPQDQDFNMKILIAQQAQRRYDKQNNENAECVLLRDAMLARKGQMKQ